jgi:hypothetical protein
LFARKSLDYNQLQEICCSPKKYEGRRVMEQDSKNKKWRHHGTSGLGGAIWFIGWLFTIAFAKLIWWQIILGIVIWPYYLGLAVR